MIAYFLVMNSKRFNNDHSLQSTEIQQQFSKFLKGLLKYSILTDTGFTWNATFVWKMCSG